MIRSAIMFLGDFIWGNSVDNEMFVNIMYDIIIVSSNQVLEMN